MSGSMRRMRRWAGEVATAIEAAMNVGLYHLGRFAQDYAARFGGHPSETLRPLRARVTN
jgi:hypothetical protein